MIVQYVRNRFEDEEDTKLKLGEYYAVLEVYFRNYDNKFYIIPIYDCVNIAENIAMFELEYFDIINPNIPPYWYFEGYTLRPKEITDEIWNDFVDTYNPKTQNIIKEVYKKIKQFHNFKDNEDIKNTFNQNKYEKTALILEDEWLMCPECSNTMKIGNDIGDFTCDNIYCQVKLNNPLALIYSEEVFNKKRDNFIYKFLKQCKNDKTKTPK